jgi:hypothetical protein
MQAVLITCVVVIAGWAAASAADDRRTIDQPRTSESYAGDPACQVKSVQKIKAEYENIVGLPGSDLTAFTQLDAKGIYQLYTVRNDGAPRCLTCEARPGGPKVDRNKPMISFHPSGKWLVVGIEKDKHDNAWMPKSWQRGLLQSGIWLNIWITTPTGDKWYQVTDYKKSRTAPSDGFVGVAFTPDGKKGVWAEIIDGNVLAHAFGVWRLFLADFSVGPDGTPALINKRDITPAGAKWVEPGNFSPDGRHLLISADIGLKDPRGQDQYSLDIYTGEVRNLTNTPNVWDEHGLYSRKGKKIAFMSSYPFRDKPNSLNVIWLKTEFMLMDADGGRLQQLTHFNTPGYPESQSGGTVAAVAGFMENGTQLFGTVMAPEFGKTNWIITFEGQCDR